MASQLWIAAEAEAEQGSSAAGGAAGGAVLNEAPSLARTSWRPLHLKGANWAGMQADGCVHELWKYDVQAYLDYLSRNGFNAVRLPPHSIHRLPLPSIAFHRLLMPSIDFRAATASTRCG